MSGFVIREAVPADAAQIGKVYYNAWPQTYAGILPEPFPAARSAERSAVVFYNSGCAGTVVAEIYGKIIGFCGWGKFRENVSEKEIYTVFTCSRYISETA